MRRSAGVIGVFGLWFGCGGPADRQSPSAAGSDASPGIDASDGGSTDTVPFPLGATWGTDAVHFRVHADAAEAVELDLYASALGAQEVARLPMTRTTAGAPWAADVGSAALAAQGITGVVYYGYRAWGPNWHRDSTWTKGSSAGFVADVDGKGNRFNPNKLLIDPYTREISHDPLQPGALSSSPYATGAASRGTDDGAMASKSMVWPPDTTDVGTRPVRALKDDVIYEVHVRGLTMNDPTIPDASRGTYTGAAMKAAALAAIGVTAVELLPIQETQNDQNDANPQGANYWGYSTIAYFAPDRRYASDKSPGGPTREFKAMVQAFHASGIKVLLDVVYNHTAEGGVSGSDPSIARLLSLRGLDNAAYYELAADHATPVDDTGTGGNVNVVTPVARDLVIDSLQYWSTTMGVDGFRFDLAAVLGNSCASDCFKFAPDDPNGILLRAANDLPARAPAGGAGVDLIAEPWGVGNGTYQLGQFPAGWSEWNGSFRDSIRIAQNELGTNAITPATLSQRIAGSPDLFGANGRAPSASIDFVDCHDGFTLHDEYAYGAPLNNQPYPLGPSSGGSTANDSWDQGGSATAQRQAARTAMALVAVSSGVPMLAGGDEMLRTQYGNNNAYNLDDSPMWPRLVTDHHQLRLRGVDHHPFRLPRRPQGAPSSDVFSTATITMATGSPISRGLIRAALRPAAPIWRTRTTTSWHGASTGRKRVTSCARSTLPGTGGPLPSRPPCPKPAAGWPGMPWATAGAGRSRKKARKPCLDHRPRPYRPARSSC